MTYSVEQAKSAIERLNKQRTGIESFDHWINYAINDWQQWIAALHFKKQIIGKMMCEKAKDTSDQEINRTLKGCVLGHKLIIFAKMLRDSGELELFA